MRDARELAHQLGPLGRVADRVAGDERRAVDHAVGEERAAARREEVALVAAQREVGEAVGAVALDERRRPARARPHRARATGSGRNHSQSAADRERADEDHQRVVDAIRPGVVARRGAARGSARRRRAPARPGRAAGRSSGRPARRTGGASRRSAASSTRCTVASSTSRPFARCATAETNDDEHREHPGAVLAAREPAREPDRRRARARARASGRPTGTPGGSTPWTRRIRSAASGVSAGDDRDEAGERREPGEQRGRRGTAHESTR